MEFVWLKSIDFFPSKDELLSTRLNQIKKICIGSKTRTIGDPLMLSTLPRKLKERYPDLKITTYPRAFNPIVFQNNPYVDGVSYLPDALYGDDNNWGHGHLIQLKENFFGLRESTSPKPELYLSAQEQEFGQIFKQNLAPLRELAIIHPWGHTWQNLLETKAWSKIVKQLQTRYTVLQVGIQGHQEIPGCDQTFFTPKKFKYARQLFAIMAQARAFVGVNSGPMHIARAFDVPSTILINEGEIDEIFQSRKRYPYYLHSNWAKAFLYESNRHLNIAEASDDQVAETIDSFLAEDRR